MNRRSHVAIMVDNQRHGPSGLIFGRVDVVHQKARRHADGGVHRADAARDVEDGRDLSHPALIGVRRGCEGCRAGEPVALARLSRTRDPAG